MKARFRPLRVSDFYELEVQSRHQYLMPVFRAHPLALQSLCDSPFSFAMEVDGKPVAAIGNTDNHEIWAFLGNDLRRCMVRLCRYCRAMAHAYGRPLKAHIDRTHADAERWALLMGMRKVKIDQKGTRDIWVFDARS